MLPLIDTPAALAGICQELYISLQSDPRLAIDTEFIRERTYAPQLELIQLAAGDTVALVDATALKGQLDPLATLLFDSSILKLVHAGGQDVEILALELGAPPASLYDTQVAAAFAGYAVQTGYGALVQSVLGVTLSKEEGFADWSRRPLTPAMREYAANDVRYLHELHTSLDTTLRKRGRDSWAAEHTNRTLSAAAEPTPPDELWRKIGGKLSFGSKELAILRELALWRDDEARRRDKPRRTVLKDEPLVEIARRKPKSATALLELRGMPPNLGEKAATALSACVVRGLATPESERPAPEIQAPLDEPGAALLELLSAIVKRRATEESLPPSLLAPADDLRRLAIERRKPSEDHPLLTGWRGELLGEPLRAALSGRLAVAWDPKRGQLALVPR
jgi:ribonuclease D